MNLQFIQVESLLTNAIYWNYDLYNTAEGKDNWNLENFSLLGPNRVPRHTDIVSRPYPMRSSAKPYLLFFDLETKLCAIILKGPVVSEPTIVYVPYDMHYSSGFKVWASSKDATWDRNNQLLYWHSDRNQLSNQIIITSYHGLNTSVLPDASKKLLDKTTITFEFSS